MLTRFPSRSKAKCKASTSGPPSSYSPSSCLTARYSSFTVDKAKSLNLTGHVRNSSDGSVTGEAQGDQSSLDKFVQHLNMGPSAADVNKVDQKDISTKEGESGFSQ
jgi:acylphosphatase